MSDNVQYVINQKASKATSGGIVFFTFKDSLGELISVKIPNTFIPIDLGMFANVADIKKSANYRTLKFKGLVKEVSEEEALKMLESPKAKAEIKRLNTLAGGNFGVEAINVSGDFTESGTVSAHSPNSFVRQTKDISEMSSAPSFVKPTPDDYEVNTDQLDNVHNDVNPIVVGVISGLAENKITEEDAMVILATLGSTLTEEDIDFVNVHPATTETISSMIEDYRQ